MPAPDIITKLVERFEENRDAYRLGRYNETQLRRDFPDPFFETLGWDVFNREGYAEMYMDKVPIRPINLSDPANKTRHDEMVSLVEQMLQWHKRTPQTPQEQEIKERGIRHLDTVIDNLVYELYGLTEEEIKIVETS